MNKGDFAALETNLGFHWSPTGVLADPRTRELAGVHTIVYDFMHVFYVAGVVNHTIGALFHSQRKSKNFTYASAYAYFKEWNFPHQNKMGWRSAIEMFSPTQAKKWLEGQCFRASASQTRSIMPVLSHYIRQGLAHSDSAEQRRAAGCFLLLSAVCEELEAYQRRTVNLARLTQSIEIFMAEYTGLSMHYSSFGIVM